VLDSNLTVEVVQTWNDHALFSDNLNLRPLAATDNRGPAVGADGRQRFAGGTSAAAAAGGVRDGRFAEVIRVRNVGVGGSSYLTFTWDRPMKDRWAANFSLARGRSTEAQSTGQTVAVDGWTRNAVFNQNAVEASRSDFEVRDRLQFTYTREFEFRKGWRTAASVYYEGRTGNPYSFTYSGDLNGDGVNGNDLVYVPRDAADPVMNFSGLNASQVGAYFAFINNSELGKYKGGYAPRNAFRQPWQNRLDLRFTQKIPLYKPAEFELFVDFVNFGYWLSRHYFGYVEELGAHNNGVFVRRNLANAAYGTDGRIAPSGVTLDSTGAYAPADAAINNAASRWRIQLGGKLRF
jgi:hypothetical protein